MRCLLIGVRAFLSIGLALVIASDAHAQGASSLPLTEILPDLILRGITLPRPTTADISHQAHFSPIEGNELNNPAVGIVQSFNKLMMVQLSTFPLGSSAGGFTYAFDESLGTFRRASSSFGPSFAERSRTIGRRKLSAGVTYQHTPYATFEGQDLDDGTIKFYLRHQECCSPGGGGGGGGGGSSAGPIEQPNGTRLSPPFEGDLIEAALSLKATTDTVAVFGNYGLTDRWDVAVVLPLVRVALDASVQATILRLATASTPLTHTFELNNPQATQKVFRRTGTATGLGDVLLRTKYHIASFAGDGLAAAIDVRLPTGDQKNLLGVGAQAKMFLIASGTMGRVLPHVNLGYTAARGDVGRIGLLAEVGKEDPLPDEFSYAAGTEFIAHPRLTIVGDIVGRTLRQSGRLAITSKSFEYQGASSVQTITFDEFDSRDGSLHLLLGTLGFKLNLVGNTLVSGHVLFPLTEAGLRSRLTTVVGLDYAF